MPSKGKNQLSEAFHSELSKETCLLQGNKHVNYRVPTHWLNSVSHKWLKAMYTPQVDPPGFPLYRTRYNRQFSPQNAVLKTACFILHVAWLAGSTIGAFALNCTLSFYYLPFRLHSHCKLPYPTCTELWPQKTARSFPLKGQLSS